MTAAELTITFGKSGHCCGSHRDTCKMAWHQPIVAEAGTTAVAMDTGLGKVWNARSGSILQRSESRMLRHEFPSTGSISMNP